MSEQQTPYTTGAAAAPEDVMDATLREITHGQWDSLPKQVQHYLRVAYARGVTNAYRHAMTRLPRIGAEVWR